MAVKTPTETYVVVRLGEKVRLGLPQQVVQEALDMAAMVVSPMPGAPPFFQGITNLRGRFLWVLDTAAWLRQLEPAWDLPQTPGREGLVVTPGERAFIMTIQGREGFVSIPPAKRLPQTHWRHNQLFPAMTHWEDQPVALVDPWAWLAAWSQATVR